MTQIRDRPVGEMRWQNINFIKVVTINTVSTQVYSLPPVYLPHHNSHSTLSLSPLTMRLRLV